MKLNNWIDDYVLDEETKKVYSDWTDWILKEDAKEDAIELIARNMLKDKIEPKIISKYTGLSIDEINALEKQEG